MNDTYLISNAAWRRKCFYQLTGYSIPSSGETKTGAQAETKVETMKEQCLLVCSHGQVNLCYTAKGEPRDDTASSELGPPTLIVTEETTQKLS